EDDDGGLAVAAGALLQERMADFGRPDVGVEVRGELVELVRVRTEPEGSLLGATHLGRGHHLHRLGDLRGVLDRLDAPADVAKVGHWERVEVRSEKVEVKDSVRLTSTFFLQP